ncbi:MAG: hypothetical protein ACP5GU_00695 [Thermoprotei archaeon]
MSLIIVKRMIRRLARIVYNPRALMEEERVAPDLLSPMMAFMIFLFFSMFKSYASASKIIEINGIFGNTFQYYSSEFIIYLIEGSGLILFSTMLLVLVSVKHEYYKIFVLFSFYLLLLLGLGRLISGIIILFLPRIQYNYEAGIPLSIQFQEALIKWAQSNSVYYILDVFIADVVPITWCIVLQSYAASEILSANRLAATFMLISAWIGVRIIIVRALMSILYGVPFI